MRLLQILDDGEVVLTKKIYGTPPPYAILSHTWSEDEDHEVSLSDLQSGQGFRKPGYRKILFCAKEAQKLGLEHFWIDTCCFDKSSSAELQETITAMFRYYSNAQVCFAYLSDVPKSKTFSSSRWFTRGWTLQELLAPKNVRFYDGNMRELGTKMSLATKIENITGIPREALSGTALSEFELVDRLQWAKGRKTKREEDQAYCLLGILGVFMYINYGEMDNALRRLEREVQVLRDDVQALKDDEVPKRLKAHHTRLTLLSDSSTSVKAANARSPRPLRPFQPEPWETVRKPISLGGNQEVDMQSLYRFDDGTLVTKAIDFCQNGDNKATNMSILVLVIKRFSIKYPHHSVSSIDQLGWLPEREKEEFKVTYESLLRLVQKEAAARPLPQS